MAALFDDKFEAVVTDRVGASPPQYPDPDEEDE
jgi:hypothetical protein